MNSVFTSKNSNMRKHTLTQDEASRFNLRQEPRYQGVFTREQSSLASIPNNARICKNKFEKGDCHPIGAQGTVLGSIGVPDLGVLYFVEWDSSPYLRSMSTRTEFEDFVKQIFSKRSNNSTLNYLYDPTHVLPHLLNIANNWKARHIEYRSDHCHGEG
jgi:hypothetical protein